MRNKFKKEQNTQGNEDFILSIQSLFTVTNKKYNFLFHLSILLECFSTKYFIRHLLLFKPEKITELGEVDNKKLIKMKGIINKLTKKPEMIYTENEEDRQKIIESFFYMAFYFNLNFQKDKVKNMFENEHFCDFLYEIFIKFGTFFKGLILPKKVVFKLIKKLDDYNQVLNFLYYLGEDVVQFLEIINEEISFITILFQKEKSKIEKENNQIKDNNKKKEITLIDVGKYVKPKKNDDIIQINFIINNLIDYQYVKGISIIKFSYSFFEKYIDFNKGVNLTNLNLINNIIKNYKKYDNSFQFQDCLDDLIHENGINLAKKGQLKNINLLEFIKTDVYFHDKKYENKRSIDIIDGIDISSLENNFFITWKNINFEMIFKNNYNNFIKKIALLIKEMKDFGLLFSFYDLYQDSEYKYESIFCMQKRFSEIFYTYLNDKCPNFIDDTIKLIYLSDKNNVNLKKFLKEDIQNLLDSEKVIEIYLKLYEEHQDLSKDIIEIIIEFFTINNNSEPSILLFLLKNCKKLGNDIFFNINKLSIKEEDFFNQFENERLKFFKGLVKENLLEKVNQYEGGVYISKALLVIKNLGEKIYNYDIAFTTLRPYFPDERDDKLEILLLDQLNYIYLLEKDKAETNFQKLKSKMIEIIKIINNLEFVYTDFRDFFNTSHFADIKKIAEICIHLKKWVA